MNPLNIIVHEKGKSSFDINKELENLNFKTLALENTEKYGKHTRHLKNQYLKEKIMNFIENVKLYTQRITRSDFKEQQSEFQRSMFVLIVIGQLIGLNPFSGLLQNDVSKIRLNIKSLKCLYSIMIGCLQIIMTLFCFINILNNSVTLRCLAYLTFYATTATSTCLFLRLARRWQKLTREVASSHLDEYIDPYIKFKCTVTANIIILLSIFEHFLSIISRISHISDCIETNNLFKTYIEAHYDWFLQGYFQYSISFGIIIILLNTLCTLTWNYSHLFIVCMSLYLSSVLNNINKKLLSTEGKFLPSSYWKSLREDYTSATRLVRVFDDHISGIILVAFASNLFFVCIQLFFVLSNGLDFASFPDEVCPNYPSGPFNGYEQVIYLSLSLLFVLSRSLVVSLITSRVHSATLVPAPVLYAVPAPAYCVEVQRFIEQVQGDMVALTGINFFHVTRELVLSVAGTIVTYELVLLQFT